MQNADDTDDIGLHAIDDDVRADRIDAMSFGSASVVCPLAGFVWIAFKAAASLPR
jgi:hypothetical protein